MTANQLKPEFLALPLSRNGLPDLLILNPTYYQPHYQTIVDAYIVSSDRDSKGYWGERITTSGNSSQKWSRLYALERAREYVVSIHSADPHWEPKPMEFLPFENWEVLAVQRELGFYPMLQMVVGSSTHLAKALQDKPEAHDLQMAPLHYRPT